MNGKTCTRCNTQYEDAAAGFARAKDKCDGFTSHCKPCLRVASASQYAAKRDKYKATRAAWYQEHREEHLTRTAERAQSNRQRNASAPVAVTGKTCPRCQTHYSNAAESFDRALGKANGLKSHCKACESAKHKTLWRKPIERLPTPDAKTCSTCARTY